MFVRNFVNQKSVFDATQGIIIRISWLRFNIREAFASLGSGVTLVKSLNIYFKQY